MNQMVYRLQPDIIVNNRNKLDGDFGTPEQGIEAEKRAWESCMTMNGSWGYQTTDDDWKTSKTVVRNLISCARDGGKLSAEHRSQTGWLRPAGVGADSECCRQVDGPQ